MDVAALAQTVISSQAGTAATDAQVSVLKKAMNHEEAAAARLLDSLALPLATEGNLGRNVNTYA